MTHIITTQSSDNHEEIYRGQARPALSGDVHQWTVLIVDDQIDNLAVAERVLSFYGAKVHTARSGEQGLLMLEVIQPSLILLDLSMPRTTGWDILKHIRSNTALAHIPVIALTAHVMVGDKERVMEAGFDGYIPKPFRIKTLLQQIKDVVANFAAHS